MKKVSDDIYESIKRLRCCIPFEKRNRSFNRKWIESIRQEIYISYCEIDLAVWRQQLK